MGSGITYGAMEALTIALGSGADGFTIESTHAGTTRLDTNDGDDTVLVLSTAGATTINTGAGADTINVRTIHAATTVNAGSGNDTINVGSKAPADDGLMDFISAPLTVRGEAGEDTLNVDDSGDITANSFILTDSTLTGLGMSDGITYATIEHLNLSLGSGPITANIRSISAATTITTGNADDVINVGSLAPASGGTLNGIGALLTLNTRGGFRNLIGIST